jgi:hypothetical protein
MGLKLKALPLRITLLSTALLVLLPAAGLLLFPRRNATGLDRLLSTAALVQSFAANTAQAPPPLWRERLGPARSSQLWASQRRIWWQFWGAHGDAGAYLVLQAPAAVPLPPNALRVDDLLVVAPDPLARQLLLDRLKVTRRAPRGLERRCSQELSQREAVLWSAAALGQMLGPLSPLVQDLQQGCLQLRSERQSLLWQGEAEATPGLLSRQPSPLNPPQRSPLPPQVLLELQGRQLALLSRGLLASQVVREALEQRYGLGPSQQRLLTTPPFRLRLRSLPQGPFQAGLELQLAVGPKRSAWQALLSRLRKGLLDQGLMEQAVDRPAEAVIWSRDDGTVVGGWRWLPGQQVLLFLGPSPTQVPASRSLEQADWSLNLRPRAMAAAGLLPENLPLLARRAAQLQLVGRSAGGRSGERQSAVAGRLDLNP